MICKTGNILDGVRQGVILQQVNAQGVMGSGIAAQIRSRWPTVWEAYSKHLGPAYTQKDSGLHFLGDIVPVEVEQGLWVINLVGQQFFGREKKRYTSYDALDKALEATARLVYDELGLMELDIHHPLLGCGLGGGEWSVVKAIIEHRLGSSTTLWAL